MISLARVTRVRTGLKQVIEDELRNVRVGAAPPEAAADILAAVVAIAVEIAASAPPVPPIITFRVSAEILLNALGLGVEAVTIAPGPPAGSKPS